MKVGATCSAVFHAAIVAFAYFGLPWREQIRMEPDSIPVMLVTQLDERTTAQRREEPKPQPKPEPPKQVVRPEPKPEPPKPEKFSFDKIAALLDKKKPAAQAEETDKRSRNQAAPAASAAPSASAIADQLTMSEKDLIRAQIERRWNVPAGARDARNLKIRVRFALNPDGSVRGMPEIVDRGRMDDPFYRAAAESAVRAVLQASPLQDLPAGKYNSWRDVELTFDPREMLGG
jgi:hypothetical protein